MACARNSWFQALIEAHISMSHVCRILLLVFLHGVGCTSIYEEAQQLLPYLRETRRALHQIPELLFELDKTSAFVR